MGISKKNRNFDSFEFLKTDWEQGFTSPSDNGDDFRFLVHGLLPDYLVYKVALLKEGGGYDPDQDIDLLRDPSKIHKKKLISTSCVDQNHRDTYGDVGLILSVPFENVLHMSPKDSGTDFMAPDAVLKRNLDCREMMSLDVIMSATGKCARNEIRLTGETEAGRVKVVGFFIKVEKDGTPINPEMAYQIVRLADISGLPLKQIKKPLRNFADQDLKVHQLLPSSPPFGLSFHENGLRYWVGLEGDQLSFQVFDDGLKARAMTKAEATRAMQLIESQLPADLLSLIKDQLPRLAATIPDLPDEVSSPKETPLPKERAADALLGAFKKPYLAAASPFFNFIIK
jgi:hypothetical protein